MRPTQKADIIEDEGDNDDGDEGEGGIPDDSGYRDHICS